jgi:transposase
MDESRDAKAEALRGQGALNSRPHDVTDELFGGSDFFDPRDRVQVKYEMLRRVRVEGWRVTQAAAAYGLSRVTFYEVRQAFEQDGMAGLLPKPRGPKGAHKLTEPVVAFIRQQQRRDRSLRAPALAVLVQERFGVSVHPRSIERALLRREKGGG